MNYLIGFAAFVLFFALLDRLRQIKWPLSNFAIVRRFVRSAFFRRFLACHHVSDQRPKAEARPVYVGMYILKMAGALGVVADTYRGIGGLSLAVEGVLIFGIGAWVWNTRRQWIKGPPPQVLSFHAPLDDAPVERWDRRQSEDGGIRGDEEKRRED